MYWRRFVTGVEVAIASAAAISKVAISNGHCNSDLVRPFSATSTVIPGFRALGFSALPGFRAPKAGDKARYIKILFGFRAPLSQLFILKFSYFYCQKLTFLKVGMVFFCRNSWLFVVESPFKASGWYRLSALSTTTHLFFAVQISPEP